VPAQYTVTDLGIFGDYYGQSYATDVNELGQVVGNATTAAYFTHAFLWNDGTMIDLGTLGGFNSFANDINDVGQVLGTATIAPGISEEHAFLITPQGGEWFRDSDLDGRNDLMIDLGAVTGDPNLAAVDINNAGQVIGNSSEGRAVLWDPVNGLTDLGLPPGYSRSYAAGINQAGQVTGTVLSGDDVTGWQYHVFLWDAVHGMTVLGSGSAAAINDVGQVIGSGSGYPAFLWTPDSANGHTGSFIGLEMPPGHDYAWASGINNAGQVVGTGTTIIEPDISEYSDAWFWNTPGNAEHLLSQLLPGSDALWLGDAVAINDGGAVAANGINSLGQERAFLLTPVSPATATIGVGDAPTVGEGNAGTRTATFTVTLSASSTQTITVAYAAGNDTATAGSDYQAASGTLTFAPGETSKTITVLVNGDRLAEPNETFFVNLSSATNATIADGQGVGTIMDDEPHITITDVTKSEGKKGKTTLFTFTVTLSAAYDQTVTMSFLTATGTATTSDSDYIAKTGTLTFAPGETTKTITIEVKGDSKKEANETFYLDLFGLSSNSLFTKNRGIGTILNDD
jgi:probable HAF family extracellular repeat protein